MAGDYKKHNNNTGFVANLNMSNDERDAVRSTPQAFSHFTAALTRGEMIVVDVQGVDDLYTDPQVHSVMLSDSEKFGVGNMNFMGIASFFSTHVCNDVCRHMGLAPFSHPPAHDYKLGNNIPLNQSGTVCATAFSESSATRQQNLSAKPAKFVYTLEELEKKLPFLFGNDDWPKWNEQNSLVATFHFYAFMKGVSDRDSAVFVWHSIQAASCGIPLACSFLIENTLAGLKNQGITSLDGRIQELRSKCDEMQANWAGHQDPVIGCFTKSLDCEPSVYPDQIKNMGIESFQTPVVAFWINRMREHGPPAFIKSRVQV